MIVLDKLILMSQRAYLQGKLTAAKGKKTKATNERKKMEQLIGLLQKKQGEINTGLETTMSNLQSRLSRLPAGTRFAQRQTQKVKAIVMNEKAEESIQETAGGIKRAKIKLLEAEDKIAACEREIRSLKQQIQQIDWQLSQEE